MKLCPHCGLQGGHDRMCQMASTFGDTEADREEKEAAQRANHFPGVAQTEKVTTTYDPAKPFPYRVHDAAQPPSAPVETDHDDITEIVRACARSTLIGYRGELHEGTIAFICDQIARKSQLEYVELSSPPHRSSAGTAEPVAYRWRAPDGKHWTYDPAPEWVEEHRHEIVLEALYTRAEPQALSEWRPIETAPKDGSFILMTNGVSTHTGRWWDGFKMWLGPGRYDLGEPTHWMPIPAPPSSSMTRPHSQSQD